MKNILLFFMGMLCPFASGISQIQTGVYTASDVRCGRNTENLELEIMHKKGAYYEAYLRTTYKDAYSRETLIEVFYTGQLQANELTLYLQNQYSITGEVFNGNKYLPGKRSSSRSRTGFAFKEMTINTSSGSTAIQPRQVGRYYSCNYPVMKFNSVLSRQKAQVRNVIQQMYNAAPTSFWAAKKTEEKVFSLYKWSEKLWQEHPELTIKDIKGLQSSYRIKDQTVFKIFRDDNFVPVFGKPFDQLSEKEKTALMKELGDLFGKTRSTYVKFQKNENKSFLYLLPWQYDFLKAAFSPCSGYRKGVCTETVMNAIEQQRTSKQKYQQMLAQLRTNPNLELKKLDAYKSTVNSSAAYLWPSEQQKVLGLVAEKQGPAAEKALRAEATPLLNGPDTYQNLKAVEQLAGSYTFSKASEQLQREIGAQIKEKCASIRATLAHNELAKLDKIAQSKNDPIGQLISWHNTFCRQFDCNKNRFDNSITMVLNKEIQIRKQLVVSNKTAIAREIKNATSTSGLTRLRNKYLKPFYHDNAVFTDLKKLADDQEEIIIFKTKKIIGNYTYEQVLAIEAQTTATGEPTEDQMKLAIIKKKQGIKNKYDQVANSNPGSGDPVGWLYKWMAQSASGVSVSMPVFEKLGCIKSANRPGYVCDCNMKETVRGGGWMDSISDMVGAHVVTHRYLKTEKYGWISLGEVED